MDSAVVALPPGLPLFPEVIDSTMRSALVACPRQFFYSHLLHLRKNTGKSVHLHFGGCFAKALETTRKAYWGRGLDEQDSIAEGIRALIHEWGDYELPPEVESTRSGVKTLAACIDAVVSYFEQHQLGNDPLRPFILDDELMVEESFSFPLWDALHPTTGKPILYCGRFDMLAVYQGATWVVDEKTALALGSQWRANWPMRAQFTGYVHGAQLLLPKGETVVGAIVRGIGIMKQNVTFEQAILPKSQWQIDQWLRQLKIDITRAISTWHIMRKLYSEAPHLSWDQNLDSACSSYGGCSYMTLCDSPDPRRWYDEYFVSPWNPLERKGTVEATDAA